MKIVILRKTYVARSFLDLRVVCANLRRIDIVSFIVVHISAISLIRDEDVDSLQFHSGWSSLLQFHNYIYNCYSRSDTIFLLFFFY